jgi:glycine betaine/choline ABC-type transport system substrate-binding protein
VTSRSPRILGAAVLAVLALALAACGSSGGDAVPAQATTGGVSLIHRDPANARRPPIAIGSKNFTEEFILADIYAQALRAAGYRVRTRLDLGSEQVAYRALRRGQVDAYPEYTGTALTSFYGVDIKDVPKDSQATYVEVRRAAAAQGVIALPPTPFTNSNGFAMTRAGAARVGARAISDLDRRAPGLIFAGPPECRAREDCLLGLAHVYGLHFARFLVTPPGQRHDVLTSGRADVSVVFTTDGQIKADDLVVLRDDRNMLPPYNATLLVRREAYGAAGPDLARVVAQVNRGLTTPVMQELNSRVDLDKEPPAQVATEYLKEAGYIR